MSGKRVKLPGGRVVTYRTDPMAKYVSTGRSNSSPAVSLTSVLPASRQTEQESQAVRPSSGQVLHSHLLDGVEVLVLGAGAIGSYVAYFLAAAASLIIRLVDFDVVDVKHTRGGRTIYEAAQAHERKVYAAKYKIERDYPNSHVHPYPYNVMDISDGDLRRLASRAVIVINAIDDGQAMLRVNDLLYSIVEVLYVALHAGAASGHVILTVPYASACLRCSLGISSAADIQTLHAEPGAGVDIRSVANHCVTIALDIMHSKVTGQPIERWDISKNVFYFANRKEQLSPDGPGAHLQRAEKRSGCAICSASPGNILLRS